MQFLVSFFFEMYFIKFAKIVPSLMTDLYMQPLKMKQSVFNNSNLNFEYLVMETGLSRLVKVSAKQTDIIPG